MDVKGVTQEAVRLELEGVGMNRAATAAVNSCIAAHSSIRKIGIVLPSSLNAESGIAQLSTPRLARLLSCCPCH